MGSGNRKISLQVEQLRAITRQQLLDLWEKAYGRGAPDGIRRELLVPFLAYRIQENAYGGLKASTRPELRKIARDLANTRRGSSLLLRPRIKLGTRFLREWRGQVHEVFVTESGFEYRGVAYKSLSEIARKITGTHWSGPAFFGLKKAHRLPGKEDE
jgi:hypothetical protein